MKQKGFTLIELLVVLALIAILAVILIVIIKPQQIFRNARDSQRSGDLRNLSSAIDTYITEFAQNPSQITWPTRGSCVTTTFFSIVTTGLPSGWATTSPSQVTTATGTTSTNVDGTGWVPLSLGLSTLLNYPKLPLDPLNGQSGTYGTLVYNFTCGSSLGEYELDAKMEANAAAMQNDGGNSTSTYEVGPNKNLF